MPPGKLRIYPSERQRYPLLDLTERWPFDPTREVPAVFNCEVEIGVFVRKHETLNLWSVPSRAADITALQARAFQNQVQLFKPRGIKLHNKAW